MCGTGDGFQRERGTGMKVEAIISDGTKDWKERLSVQSKRTAEKDIQEIVDEYNRVEVVRYGDSAVLRKLVRIVKGKDD